jgi:hypothetical protein
VLALRFLPLVFMIAGFFIWRKLYRDYAENGAFLIFLLLAFAASHFTTYYSAEFKQYSCDLFSVGIFVMFIYYQARCALEPGSLRRLKLFSVLAPVLVFFSYMSALLMWVAAYNYLFLARKDRRFIMPLASYTFIASVCCIMVFLFDIRFSMANPAMHDYWKDYFVSLNSLPEFFKSLTEGLRNITARWYLEKKWAIRFATVFLPFCWVAIVKYSLSSLKKDKGAVFSLDSLCAVLLIQLFVLGALQLYPFTGCRATLFIAPFIFYMTVKGIFMLKRFKIIFYPLSCTYAIFLCAISYNLFREYLKLYVQ